MTPENIVQQAHDAGARLVRFLYCDNGGTIRGKATALSGLGGRLSDGIGLTVAMMAMNSLDQLQPVEGMGPVGEIRLLPDPESFALLPYAPHSAAMSCDMLTGDRTPWGACPRTFLKRMRERAAAQGYTLHASMEAEFSLARRQEDGSYVPFDDALCFSSIAMTQAAPFAGALVAALEAQGITVEQYYPELGHGQHEVSIRHAEVLRAADNHIKLRETIRGVALEYGLYASLAPKPFPDQAGNGAHIHFSLWDARGRNVFYDRAAPDGLSTIGQQFIAGVLGASAGAGGADLPELQLVQAASAAIVEQRLHRLGPRQPRGGGAGGLAVLERCGGIDQPGAEGGRQLVQPVHRAGRAARGRAGWHRARADAKRFDRGRSGEPIRRRARRAWHPPPAGLARRGGRQSGG